MSRAFLVHSYRTFCSLFFNPREMFNKWRGVPYFACNLLRYHRLNNGGAFCLRLSDIFYSSHDRFGGAGSTQGHYFWQDLWAARYLYEHRVTNHVDVGSRLDGFVGHILPFCKVRYFDLRPLRERIEGLEFVQSSILAIPLQDNSVPSLSCLHVIEHIGLGRYGDPVDPDGYLRAAKELSRVLGPDGTLLISTPVGRQRVCFDAHRIFDPQMVVRAFSGLNLVAFSLIDDKGMGLLAEASFEEARGCTYGCGLFVFTKLTG